MSRSDSPTPYDQTNIDHNLRLWCPWEQFFRGSIGVRSDLVIFYCAFLGRGRSEWVSAAYNWVFLSSFSSSGCRLNRLKNPLKIPIWFCDVSRLPIFGIFPVQKIHWFFQRTRWETQWISQTPVESAPYDVITSETTASESKEERS